MRYLLSFVVIFVIFTFSFSKSADSGKPSCFVGIFKQDVPGEDAKLANAEQLFGKRFPTVMWYRDFKQPFPYSECAALLKTGRIPHITWEPWFWQLKPQEMVPLDEIIDGTWDDYILGWAREAVRLGGPVFLRWGHEFNGDWYPWCLGLNGNTPQKYAAAFRHIKNIFDNEGCVNVRWIWSPNNYPLPPLESYPGDDYVDIIGIDCYNFGANPAYGTTWKSFSAIFGQSYIFCRQFFPTKPLIIAEMASSTQGGNRRAWLTEMENDIRTKYPNLRGFVWFDIDKETDWYLRQQDTFNEIFADPYYDVTADSLLADLNHLVDDAGGIRLDDQRTSEELHKKYSIAIPVDTRKPGTNLAGITRPVVRLNPANAVFRTTTVNPLLHASIHAVVSDTKILTVTYDVSDPTPLCNTQDDRDIWNGDAVELCLRLDPKSKELVYGAGDYQIGLKVSQNPQIFVWHGDIPKEALTCSVSEKPEGYTAILTIDLYALNRAMDTEFFINFAIDDGGPEGHRTQQLVWTREETFYLYPSRWGRASLVSEY